jgi:hypothetical protein
VQRVTLSPLETGTGAEAALLLCALRTALHAASAEQLRRLVQQETDWPGLTDMALRHGVMPLLYTSLSATCPEVVPRAALDCLRQHFHTNVQRNLFLASTLRKLLRLLEAHGILAIPYKGPVLATVAYGHLALRQFADLDLLVRPQDANRARALLFAHGYRWQHGRAPMRWPGLLKVYELLSADGQVLVELHWALTSATFFCPLDPAPWWTRLETVGLLETPVRSLAREDLLLILCIHGAKHHWSRLGWICDVAALLRVSPQLNWERCLAQASQCGGKRMLALGLSLAHDLLGASLPAAVERWIQTEAAVPWLAAQVRAELFTATANPPNAWDHPAFYLGLRERRRDRLPCYVYLAYRTLLPAVLKNRLGRDQRLKGKISGGDVARGAA